MLFAMLLGVAVSIALFGLVASMATAVIERRWEIGVLKAVGLRRGHLFRMFAAEAVTLTVSSGLLGEAWGSCWPGSSSSRRRC
jgi:putative ABC transport system permease protein